MHDGQRLLDTNPGNVCVGDPQLHRRVDILNVGLLDGRVVFQACSHGRSLQTRSEPWHVGHIMLEPTNRVLRNDAVTSALLTQLDASSPPQGTSMHLYN